MTTGSDGLTRLGNEVRSARTALRLSQEKAAGRAEISRETWARVERALSVDELRTYPAIERVLDWAPGTCLRLLSGETDTPLRVVEVVGEDPSIRTLVATAEQLTASDRRRLAALAQAYLQMARDMDDEDDAQTGL